MQKEMEIHKWKEFFDDWKKSGKSRQEYCEEKETTIYKFDYWRQRVRKSEEQNNEDFIKLKISGFNTEKNFILKINNKLSLEIPPGFSKGELKKILEVF